MPWLPSWIRRAVEPTPTELSHLETQLDTPLLNEARTATEPLETEVRALVRPPIPQPNAGHFDVRWTVWVLVPAMALLLWSILPGTMPPPEVPTPNPPEIADVVPAPIETPAGVALGPSIRYQLNGTATVDRAPDGRHRIILDRGAVHVDVDPNGRDRLLIVVAGDVSVSVVGTIFDVAYVQDQVHVDVSKGTIRITSPEGETVLQTGEHWRSAPAAHTPTPTPPAQKPSPEASAQPDPARAFVHLLDLADTQTTNERALLVEIDTFLAREDTAPFRLEARALRLEIDARIRPAKQIIPEIDAFLTDHPDAPRRLGLLEIRATLARENQDCEGALPTYRNLSSEASGAQLARVQAWQGLCARQLGHDAEARTALQNALKNRVAEPLKSDVQKALDQMNFLED